MISNVIYSCDGKVEFPVFTATWYLRNPSDDDLLLNEYFLLTIIINGLTNCAA